MSRQSGGCEDEETGDGGRGTRGRNAAGGRHKIERRRADTETEMNRGATTSSRR